MDEARNRPAEVEQGMQFDGGPAGPKWRPGEDGQTEIDNRRIQGIDRVGQLQPQLFAGIQGPGRPDERLSELGVDAPIARFVGIGEGRATDAGPQAHVIELGRLGGQTRLDIPQALAERELRKGHAAELLGTGEALDPMIAPVSTHKAMKRLPGRMIHDLGKEQFAAVHEHLPREIHAQGAPVGQRDSSRGQVAISQTPRPSRGFEHEPSS